MLVQRVQHQQCSKRTKAEEKRERKKKKRMKLLYIVVVAVATILFSIYVSVQSDGGK